MKPLKHETRDHCCADARACNGRALFAFQMKLVCFIEEPDIAPGLDQRMDDHLGFFSAIKNMEHTSLTFGSAKHLIFFESIGAEAESVGSDDLQLEGQVWRSRGVGGEAAPLARG